MSTSLVCTLTAYHVPVEGCRPVSANQRRLFRLLNSPLVRARVALAKFPLAHGSPASSVPVLFAPLDHRLMAATGFGLKTLVAGRPTICVQHFRRAKQLNLSSDWLASTVCFL
jgi:hypothetical protein